MSTININDLTLGQIEQLKKMCIHSAEKVAEKVAEKERPVMITTEYRGIFFGYASDTSGDVVRLKRARNCLYWTAKEKGFLGLAGAGPSDGCRIGPPVKELELRKVTSVTEVSEEAVKAWEAAPFAT